MTIVTIPFKEVPSDQYFQERRRIVKAAVKVDDVVYLGWRHSQIIRHLAYVSGKYTGQEQQGFTDQFGNFYDRCMAGKIAARAGQAKFLHNTLLSEQLWDSEGKPHKQPYNPGER